MFFILKVHKQRICFGYQQSQDQHLYTIKSYKILLQKFKINEDFYVTFVNTVFYEITFGLRVVINFTVKIHNKTTVI